MREGVKRQEKPNSLPKPKKNGRHEIMQSMEIEEKGPMTSYERKKAWRARHPEKHRELHREYMKRWRERKKAQETREG